MNERPEPFWKSLLGAILFVIFMIGMLMLEAVFYIPQGPMQ